MNEQNLPENTKKEVKETAVPVVSNDSPLVSTKNFLVTSRLKIK